MSIKILHIIESLSRGGAEKRLLNDLKYLNKSGFSNIVCHIFRRCELKGEIFEMAIPVCCLELENPYQFIKALARLMRIVKAHRPNIIHTQLFTADIYGRIIGKLFKIPVVSTIQSSVYEPGVEYFRSSKRRLIDSLTGSLCNSRFIAVSEFVKESAIRRLGFRREKIEVIYNYVDEAKVGLSKERSCLRKSLGLEQDALILITIGKLNPPKGHHYIFEAMADIIRQRRAVKLLVVGEGPSKNSLIELKDKLGLNSHVRFLGERNDIQELLSLSDIFVFSSLSEGLPISLLEAMFMARPCVAFNLAPMTEVIDNGQTGLLVEPKNSKAMAEAISALINDPDKAFRLGNAARKLILNKFSAAENTQRLNRLYDTILDRQ